MNKTTNTIMILLVLGIFSLAATSAQAQLLKVPTDNYIEEQEIKQVPLVYPIDGVSVIDENGITKKTETVAAFFDALREQNKKEAVKEILVIEKPQEKEKIREYLIATFHNSIYEKYREKVEKDSRYTHVLESLDRVFEEEKVKRAIDKIRVTIDQVLGKENQKVGAYLLLEDQAWLKEEKIEKQETTQVLPVDLEDIFDIPTSIEIKEEILVYRLNNPESYLKNEDEFIAKLITENTTDLEDLVRTIVEREREKQEETLVRSIFDDAEKSITEETQTYLLDHLQQLEDDYDTAVMAIDCPDLSVTQ